jgi:hypothetical protein
MHNLGVTLSHRKLHEMQLSVDQALQQTLSMGFSYVRLCVYGDESIEAVTSFVQTCEQASQPVIVTIGVKAPRWPEFYWPETLTSHDLDDPVVQTQLLEFVTQTVGQLQHFRCIEFWQIENEPLDPSGQQQLQVPLSLLEQEVSVVRSLDDRPIMLTVWGNDVIARDTLRLLSPMCDVLGVDLYPRQFTKKRFGRSNYIGPAANDEQLQSYLSSQTIPVWISELQAEPWEKDEAAYRSDTPGSFSPEKLRENILWAKALVDTPILLFGWEYCLWRASLGDVRYLEVLSFFD